MIQSVNIDKKNGTVTVVYDLEKNPAVSAGGSGKTVIIAKTGAKFLSTTTVFEGHQIVASGWVGYWKENK